MSTPYQQGEIAPTVDEIRESLAQEFPRLAPIQGLPVRSSDFERALPELLAASQKARLNDLRLAVGTLNESTDKLLGATKEAARTSARLYLVTWLLLAVALATLSVAVLQVVR